MNDHVEVPKRRRSILNRKMNWLRKTFRQKKKMNETEEEKEDEKEEEEKEEKEEEEEEDVVGKIKTSLNNIHKKNAIKEGLCDVVVVEEHRGERREGGGRGGGGRGEEKRKGEEGKKGRGGKVEKKEEAVRLMKTSLYRLRSMEIVKVDCAEEKRCLLLGCLLLGCLLLSALLLVAFCLVACCLLLVAWLLSLKLCQRLPFTRFNPLNLSILLPSTQSTLPSVHGAQPRKSC